MDVQLANVRERAEQTQQVAWLKRCTRAFLLLGQVILRIMRSHP